MLVSVPSCASLLYDADRLHRTPEGQFGGGLRDASRNKGSELFWEDDSESLGYVYVYTARGFRWLGMG